MEIHEQALFQSVMSELEVGDSLQERSFSFTFKLHIKCNR